MAGSLFIVTIPTENAEIVFNKKPNRPQSIDSSGFVKFASVAENVRYENLSNAMVMRTGNLFCCLFYAVNTN